MDLNKLSMKKIRELIIFTVLLVVALWKFEVVIDVLKTIGGIIFPFVLGGAIAFVINVPMSFLEKKIFGKAKEENKAGKKLARPVSLLLTIILAVGVVVLVMFGVIPQLTRTIASLYRLHTFTIKVNHTLHPTSVFVRIHCPFLGETTLLQTHQFIRFHANPVIVCRFQFYGSLNQHYLRIRSIVIIHIKFCSKHLHSKIIGMNQKRMLCIVCHTTICWNPGRLPISFTSIISAIQMLHGVRFPRCSLRTMQLLPTATLRNHLVF